MAKQDPADKDGQEDEDFDEEEEEEEEVLDNDPLNTLSTMEGDSLLSPGSNPDGNLGASDFSPEPAGERLTFGNIEEPPPISMVDDIQARADGLMDDLGLNWGGDGGFTGVKIKAAPLGAEAYQVRASMVGSAAAEASAEVDDLEHHRASRILKAKKKNRVNTLELEPTNVRASLVNSKVGLGSEDVDDVDVTDSARAKGCPGGRDSNDFTDILVRYVQHEDLEQVENLLKQAAMRANGQSMNSLNGEDAVFYHHDTPIAATRFAAVNDHPLSAAHVINRHGLPQNSTGCPLISPSHMCAPRLQSIGGNCAATVAPTHLRHQRLSAAGLFRNELGGHEALLNGTCPLMAGLNGQLSHTRQVLDQGSTRRR